MADSGDARLNGGPGGWLGGGPGRGRRGLNRVRRGDVQAAVLRLLAEQDMHGYQMIQELAERSGGAWRPGAGSIYPTLRQLAEQGLIRSRPEGSKRVFSITDYGRRSASSATGDPEPWQPLADAAEGRVKLRQATEALLSAIGQVEHGASDAEAAEAAEIISAARKSLYLMLAES